MKQNETLHYEFDRPGWLASSGYLKRRILFLDLNHWIGLADGQEASYRKLSEALHEAVDSGQVICPVSPSLLMEVEKRSSDDKRRRYCQLMDHLSGGLSLRVSTVTFAEEFRAIALGESINREVAYSLFVDAMSSGSRLEFPKEWEKESAKQAAKLVFEELESWPVLEAVEALTEERREQIIGQLRDGWSELARQAGEWKKHNKDMSAKDIEQTEFAATARALVPQIAPFLLEAEDSVLRALISTSEDDKREMLSACPIFWCKYKMAAAIRWHKETLKENDLWDLEHVVSATPYVDCVACDGGTRHICTHVARLDDKFETRIVSKPSEILDWLIEQN